MSIILKINLLDPRAPPSNKHLFAAADAEVIATVGVMNGSGSQTQICWQISAYNKEVASYMFQSSREK